MSPASAHAYVETVLGSISRYPLRQSEDLYAPKFFGRLVAFNSSQGAHSAPKAFDALLPGGEMHLIGETLDDDRRGPVGPALWGLSEAIGGTTGLAHTNADCIGYFENAGFVDVSVNEFVPGALARITGHKPS